MKIKDCIGKYKLKISCYNCGTTGFVLIPKGTTVDNFIWTSKENVCDYCGCHRRKK
jgi:hypothetical protein